MNRDRRARRLVLSGVILSAAGILLSVSLLRLHVSPSPLLASMCGEEGAGCDKVLRSRWAVFPPGAADADGADDAVLEEPAGIPVAACGFFYFTVTLVWFAIIGQPGPRRRWMHLVLLGVAVLSCLGSLWFIVVMSWFVKAWCPLCLGSHLVNFLLLGAMIGFRPRRETSTAATAATRGARARKPAPIAAIDSHPSPRLLIASLLLAVSLCVAGWQSFRVFGLAGRNLELSEQLRKQVEDVHALEMSFFRQKKQEIVIRDDDPIIAPGPGSYSTVVLFSDIECPACSKFDNFLFDEVSKLFNGHLRIVFKHYPLRSLHPSAFKAATALDAARRQGLFWPMHDLLLEHRLELADLKYARLAAKLNMDVPRFLLDMYSDDVDRRVLEDMRQGRKLGVDGTPAVFLDGRRVDKVMRNLPGFWKLRAESLKATRASRGQSW